MPPPTAPRCVHPRWEVVGWGSSQTHSSTHLIRRIDRSQGPSAPVREDPSCMSPKIIGTQAGALIQGKGPESCCRNRYAAASASVVGGVPAMVWVTERHGGAERARWYRVEFLHVSTWLLWLRLPPFFGTLVNGARPHAGHEIFHNVSSQPSRCQRDDCRSVGPEVSCASSSPSYPAWKWLRSRSRAQSCRIL